MKANLLTQVILPASLFIIMMGMGLSLKLKDFSMVLTRPKAMAIGLAAQMLLLPIVAFGIAIAFDMPPLLAVGLVILALCPGGTTSNLYTYLAKGDVALSISLTAVVSLIAPFSIPLVAAFAMDYFLSSSQVIELPLIKTILQLVVITIVPVSLGMLIYKFAPTIAEKVEKPVKIFSLVILFVIIAGIIFKNKESMLGFFADTGLPALTLNIVCMLLGYGLGKVFQLNEAQSKTIGIEVGLQNGTTALLITLTILGNNEMAIPPTIYSILMFFTGAAFAWILSTKRVA